MLWVLDLSLFAGGYAASVYTWPWLRTKVQGVQAEVASLEARANALKASATTIIKSS